MMILEATELANHTHLIWGNVFFYLFIGIFVVFTTLFFGLMRILRKKASDQKLLQQQHVARVDVIRKENEEKVDNIRVDMLRREEERSRQWQESEKETLRVLGGVSSLLDLSERIDRNNSDKILKLLGEIQDKVENLTVK